LQTADLASDGQLASRQVLVVLDTTFSTAGFVLVSVSFTCFGLLMLRGFSGLIGWIAIVAGVFTLLGQIPSLTPLFMVANVAYIAWYVGSVADSGGLPTNPYEGRVQSTVTPAASSGWARNHLRANGHQGTTVSPCSAARAIDARTSAAPTPRPSSSGGTTV
jgi:hypothetical protein